MSHHKASAMRLIQDESGQNLIEYALIACLVALAAISSLESVGTGIRSAFQNIAGHLNSQN